jgi:phosphotransferase system HPr (HPr) family protein
MPSREVMVVNKLGLHLRAAAAFVQLAEKYPCRVTILKAPHKANGKSILSVLALGAPRGEAIVIDATGDQADAALDALTAFVAARFGEPE